MGLPRPHWILVTLHWIPTISWPPNQLVKQVLCICRQSTDQIELKFGSLIHYVISRRDYLWLQLFLASALLSSFQPSADKLCIHTFICIIIGLNSDLVDKLIRGLPRPAWILIMLFQIPAFNDGNPWWWQSWKCDSMFPLIIW